MISREKILNPFQTSSIACGYASSRPAVHPRIIELVRHHIGKQECFHHAVDVGCGAGLSTKALEAIAEERTGIDPAEAMMQWSSQVAPGAHFIVASAEAIPIRDGAADLMTAAGSLNYANLDLFFPEAARVLGPNGILVVYDFSPGRTFRDSDALDEWFSRFTARYPWPRNEARVLDAQILTGLDSGFRLTGSETFRIALTLTQRFYVSYMLTESNVTFAVRGGTPYEEIRSWIAETLAPVWGGRDREVLFSGYFACMQMAARTGVV
jgi:SAM-dependent methyltransferase